MNSDGSPEFLSASASCFVQRNLGQTRFFFQCESENKERSGRKKCSRKERKERLPLEVRSSSARRPPNEPPIIQIQSRIDVQSLGAAFNVLPSQQNAARACKTLLNATFYIYQPTKRQRRRVLTTAAPNASSNLAFISFTDVNSHRSSPSRLNDRRRQRCFFFFSSINPFPPSSAG